MKLNRLNTVIAIILCFLYGWLSTGKDAVFSLFMYKCATVLCLLLLIIKTEKP